MLARWRKARAVNWGGGDDIRRCYRRFPRRQVFLVSVRRIKGRDGLREHRHGSTAGGHRLAFSVRLLARRCHPRVAAKPLMQSPM